MKVQSGASNPEMSNNNYVQVPFKKHPNVQTKMSKTKMSKINMSKMIEITQKNHSTI